MADTKYLSVSQYCKKYGKDGGWVRRMLAAGRIPGTKVGNQWVIPADAEPPADRRIKSGKYRNWRSKPSE